VIYGTPASTRDPARFSFAVGGKDGFPYPVDLETYNKTVEVLRAAVNKANIDRSERVKALKRLVEYGRKKIAGRQEIPAGRPASLQLKRVNQVKLIAVETGFLLTGRGDRLGGESRVVLETGIQRPPVPPGETGQRVGA